VPEPAALEAAAPEPVVPKLTIPKLNPSLDFSSGLDELNLGRLTLNSAQKTVPSDLRRWEKSILTPDGRPVFVVCTVGDGEVVPHGLDNDFMVGLINLCFEAGVPSGPFTTTGYALLKAAGLPDSAQYYTAMGQSLRRLSKAKYSVDEAWYRHQGSSGEWLSQEFSQISYLAFRRSNARVSAGGIITVQLGVPILESLRSGYIKPLDLEFYRTLSQPLVRALYRQLDALHFDEGAEDGLAKDISAPLLAWAVRLGLFSDRPDNLVRALEPAHAELLEREYLSAVEHGGRGRGRTVRYVFRGPPRTDHPDLAELLMNRGVKKGMALRLSSAFPERIPAALERFDHYLKSSRTPVNNPAGLLVAMIKSPEQYEGLEATPPTKAAPTKVAPLEDTTPLEDAQALHLAQLPSEEKASWVVKQLNLLGVLKHLSVHEKAALGDALSSGSLEGEGLLKQATAAAFRGTAGILEWLEQLRSTALEP